MKKYLAILGIVTTAVIMTIPLGMSYGAEEGKIPEWFKIPMKLFLDGEISDTEFINSLEFLAKEKILNIEYKQYDKFSKEKFPDTGGFNPDWLEGEKDKILKSCLESSKMGFENSYCQYVQ